MNDREERRKLVYFKIVWRLWPLTVFIITIDRSVVQFEHSVVCVCVCVHWRSQDFRLGSPILLCLLSTQRLLLLLRFL